MPTASLQPSIVRRLLIGAALTCAALGVSLHAQAAEPLKIGYSDWPGYVAWQVAIEKNWFKEAGVDVKFEWFDYSASLDAFTAGKLDAVTATNGDTLVTGAGGAKGKMVLLLDYSNGNDMIIAKPGIRSLADLKGKKLALEVGLLEHLMLSNAMKKAGMKVGDITLVNAKTNELPQVFTAKDVAAVAVWQPVANQALKAVPGAKPLTTSADEPGLLYDVLTVTPTSLKARRADWEKMVAVWGKVVAYINDPKTQPDAVKIMSARSGVTPAEYLPFLAGTRLLNLDEGRLAFAKADGFKSLYGSSEVANTFNVDNKVYPASQKVDTYIDPSLLRGAK